MNSSKTQHTCKSCGNTFTGRFCNECGEKVYTNDRSFKHLVEEVLHFFTHFEGTIINSVKAMFSKPGKISVDFCNGIRKRYFKPLSFFLLLVVIYLLFPVLEGLNMQLRYYPKNNLYGAYATEQIEQVKQEKHLTDEQLAEQFHRKGEKVSKFLLFVLLPSVALASFALAFKNRPYYFDHFIFSTELVSFFILFTFLILPLVMKLTQLMGFQLFSSEGALALFVNMVLAVYLAIAARRFFQFKRWASIGYSLFIVAFLWYFLGYVYKFILFSIAIQLV